MWNARLDEAQAGIKISGRNINNLRYADDTTLMAESEEELKSLLMKVMAASNSGMGTTIGESIVLRKFLWLRNQLGEVRWWQAAYKMQVLQNIIKLSQAHCFHNDVQ